jgi:hypothetical protein
VLGPRSWLSPRLGLDALEWSKSVLQSEFKATISWLESFGNKELLCFFHQLTPIYVLNLTFCKLLLWPFLHRRFLERKLINFYITCKCRAKHLHAQLNYVQCENEPCELVAMHNTRSRWARRRCLVSAIRIPFSSSRFPGCWAAQQHVMCSIIIKRNMFSGQRLHTQ